MVINLYLDVCFNLGSVIQLIFCLDSTVLAVIFKGVLPIIVRISTHVLGHVRSRSEGSALVASTTAGSLVVILECLVLGDNIVANGNVLTLNHMDYNLALFD
jgi:hypothetical protein